MRDHDEVFRRVMKAKEQYEQQKKEKTMYKIMKNAPGGGASDDGRKPSKAFVWAMRVVAALVAVLMIGGIAAVVYFGSKDRNPNGRSAGEGGQNTTMQPTNTLTGRPTNTPTAGP